MTPAAAMIRAVEDKIADLKNEKRHAMAPVRAEFDKRTGKSTAALYSRRDAEGAAASMERPQTRQDDPETAKQATDDRAPVFDAASA